MPSNVTRIARVVAATSAIALVVAGCSSSKSSGGSGGSSSAASGSSATGSPILVGSELSVTSAVYSQPDAKAGLVTAIAAINAKGGVKGHPLKLDFCDTQYTVNGELTCARKLAADKVAAVIGPQFLADQSGAETTLLAKANIPIFGTQGLSPAELNNADVYPLSSGLPGWAYGAADQMLRAGATKIAIMVDTNPGSQFGASLITTALKSAGKTSNGTVIGDPTSDPTFSTAAAKVTANGTNGVLLFPSPVNVPKMVAALKQAGYTGKIGTLSVIFPQALITALGSAAEGVLVDSQAAFTTDTSIPAVAQYLADTKQYDGTVSDASLFNWSATELFAKAIDGATSYDAAGISAALKSVSSPIDIGTVGPWQSSGVTSPLSDYTRILNPTVTYGSVQGGKVIADGKGFINPFTSLSSQN
jgi:ABC-type branched-subunit amino acid transport system substrate-binding protein